MRHSDDSHIREFPVADATAGPYGITAGPDGALWITLARGARVARLSFDGELSVGQDGSLRAALETDSVARLAR